MDHLPRRWGLIGFALVILLYAVSPVSRASANPSYDAAMASCQSYVAGSGKATFPGYSLVCMVSSDRSSAIVASGSDGVPGDVVYLNRYACAALPQGEACGIGGWTFSGAPPPSNPCTSLASSKFTIDIPANDAPLTNGYTYTQSATDSTGASVACTMVYNSTSGCVKVMTPEGPQWQCTGTATPSGDPASLSSGQKVGDWSDPSGATPDPAPPNVAANPPTPATAPPQVCGGQSCFDPATMQYCGVGASGQFCVPAAQADTSAGGCLSSGGVTLCAGNPTAPAPPAPPASQITDPQTQFKGSDQFQSSDPQSGAVTQVSTAVYAAPGASSSSGAKSTSSQTGAPSDGSSSPAPASSSSGAGSFGDNGCNTPVSCSGDAVMCGIAQETQQSKCASQSVAKALTGDGSSPQLSTGDASKLDGGTVDLGDITGGTGGSGGTGTGTGHGLDDSGLGWATQCPFVSQSITVGDSTFTLDMTPICTYGPWMEGFILLLAAMKWADIVGTVK